MRALTLVVDGDISKKSVAALARATTLSGPIAAETAVGPLSFKNLSNYTASVKDNIRITKVLLDLHFT